MTVNEGTRVDEQVPGRAAPNGGIGHSGTGHGGQPAFVRATPGSVRRPGTVETAADQRPDARGRELRIGDKVRSLVDDVCVSVGLTGLVVNVVPARYGAPARARILWDNETVSLADAPTFEVHDDSASTAADDVSKVA